MMPSGTATTRANAMAQPPRISVNGMCEAISDDTFTWNRNESPKSPRGGARSPVEELHRQGAIETEFVV